MDRTVEGETSPIGKVETRKKSRERKQNPIWRMLNFASNNEPVTGPELNQGCDNLKVSQLIWAKLGKKKFSELGMTHYEEDLGWKLFKITGRVEGNSSQEAKVNIKARNTWLPQTIVGAVLKQGSAWEVFDNFTDDDTYKYRTDRRQRKDHPHNKLLELEIGPEFEEVTVVTEETDQEDQNKERVRLLEQNKVEFTKITEGTEEIIVVTNKKPQSKETPIQDNQDTSGGDSEVVTKEGGTDLPKSTVAGPSR